MANGVKLDILFGLLMKTTKIEHLWQPPSLTNHMLFKAYQKIMTPKEVRTLVIYGHNKIHTVSVRGEVIRSLIRIVQERDSLWHNEAARFEEKEKEAN